MADHASGVDNDSDTGHASAGPEMSRPSLPELRSRFLALFTNPHLTLSDLREQTLSTHGLASSSISEDEIGSVTLRSLYWRLFLGQIRLENLCTAGGNHFRALAEDLGVKRRKYNEQRDRWLRAPDGRWAADCVADELDMNDGGTSQSGPISSAPNLLGGSSTWDPLNQGEEVRSPEPAIASDHR